MCISGGEKPFTRASVYATRDVRAHACYPLIPYSNRIEGAKLAGDLDLSPMMAAVTKLYEHYGFSAVEEKDGTVTMKADL